MGGDNFLKMSGEIRTCTVIGGCGFLGRHMVETLLSNGYTVNVFDIRVTHYDERVQFFSGDLCNINDLLPALRGSDVVFHHASPPASNIDKALFHKVNVEGTGTLIEACKMAGVTRLVLTSSASVVYNGSDVKNGTEDMPYASPPMDYYTETKILQEQLVLRSNNKDRDMGQLLLTVAIRPHGIFGPRDTQNIPTILEAAKAGKMKFMIGDGKNIVDFTYVDNVVQGHLLAAKNLNVNSQICGQAYNITNDEPVEFGYYINQVVTGFGYPSPQIHLPYYLILFMAIMTEWGCWLLSPFITFKPLFTPLRVRLAGTFHYYSCQKAKDHFNYRPIVSFHDGICRSLDYFKQKTS
jgi:sterol-4alpha-carboxylate 3-dehydrogenase (decarboxylating)